MRIYAEFLQRLTHFHRNPLSLVAFLILLTWGQAYAQSNFKCSNLFLEPKLEIRDFKFEDLLAPEVVGIGTAKQKHVVFNGLMADSVGLCVRLKRIGQYWRTNYFKDIRDLIEGSPLSFVQIVGPKIASFFGFHKLVGADEILAPTAERINLAIKKINLQFKRRGIPEIEFNYFDKKGEITTDLLVLLNEMVENASFPLYSHPDIVVHDLAYHVTAILIPKIVLDHTRNQSRIVRDFHNFVMDRVRNVDSLERSEIEAVLRALVHRRVYQTDVGSGNLTTAMNMVPFLRKYELEKSLGVLVEFGLNPVDYITKNVDSIISARSASARQSGTESNAIIIVTRASEIIKGYLIEFLRAQKDPILYKSLRNNEGQNYNVDDYLKSIEGRIKEIEEVLND